MQYQFFDHLDIEGLETLITKDPIFSIRKSFMLFVADESLERIEELDAFLKSIEKPIIGGVFPEFIFKGERKSKGCMAVALPYHQNTITIPVSSNHVNMYEDLLDELNKKRTVESQSLLIYLDAFASGKHEFLEEVFNYFGNTFNYLGGGAGSLSFEQKPCIITNDGLKQDVAIVSMMENQIPLGVAHGWQAISEPIKVTKAEGNTVLELDWKPAFEVYKELVENHSNRTFTDDNFFDIAKMYPLGIAKLDAEFVVRDPLQANGNSLILVDEVHENEFVQLLHGNMDNLLKGAQKAKVLASNNADVNKKGEPYFCIDCISRVLYMQDNFSKEIEIISDSEQLNGVLTIGEIANSGQSFLEIFNKTVVVTQF